MDAVGGEDQFWFTMCGVNWFVVYNSTDQYPPHDGKIVLSPSTPRLYHMGQEVAGKRGVYMQGTVMWWKIV